MVALGVLRDQVIRPLLAASGKLTPRPKLPNQTRVDRRYENLRDTCDPWTSGVSHGTPVDREGWRSTG
jgi:hypothetical protein